jgi:hypothetical protein
MPGYDRFLLPFNNLAVGRGGKRRHDELVDEMGFEPTTSSLRTRKNLS